MRSRCDVMPRSGRVWPFLMFLFLAFAAAAAATAAAAAQTANWRLACADGSTVDFHESLAQGPVLVSFWALWCKPCLKELPHLDQLARDHAGRLTVLAVNIDSQRSVAKVAPFLHARDYALRVPLDTAGDLSRQLQVGEGVPFLILFDGEGREVYRHTGYREGDEIRLREEVERLLAAENDPAAADRPVPADGVPAGALGRGVVALTDQFEYSYSTETEREIVENWLDVSYYLDGLRTGILLSSQQPSEEGGRANTIRHRFFEFAEGGFTVRAGNFYGLFGRGLVFAAYEDRNIRVDNGLDGVIVTRDGGHWAGTFFTGTPDSLDVDVRGADLQWKPGGGLVVGCSGLTYMAPELRSDVNREWVVAGRLHQKFAFGGWYVEAGANQDYDNREFQRGHAFYGSLNLYGGPFTLSLEAKDYYRFAVLRGADGKVTLNNPPSLTREHLYTLTSRNAHNVNADDERGGQAELTWTGPQGWSLLTSANRTENDAGDLLFAEAYGQAEKEAPGRYRIRGAYGYQDASHEGKGWSQFAICDLTLDLSPTRSLSVQAEHQHTELGDVVQRQDGGVLHPGAFDTECFAVEFAQAPHWTFAALFETSNKVLPEQRTESGEKEGPFPSLSVSYATSRGGIFTVWCGKRQAGQICTGGVCKLEPAFEGIEVYGTFRY